MAPSSAAKKKASPAALAATSATTSEYQTIAAQFAAAKRAKAAKDAQDAEQRNIQARRSALERRHAVREAARKAAYERRWLWTAAFWLWLLAIHAAGLVYFTSGFLLSRLVLEEHSSCSANPLGMAAYGGGNAASGCWHPKTFDRAVVLVIDALRYDFTVPFDNSSSSASYYHNAFPFLYDTAVADPTRAFLRPFIADPPTTTLQRLKGLTTGTLPTFIDIGSNFAGTAIEEDNLLTQARAENRTIVHLGDDTWTALFPGYFEPNRSHAYDSFNTWDLHTVDNGVQEHIFPLLEEGKDAKGSHAWDLLIGHCLGVDHAGHSYGPDHPAMREKLQQMDAFVRRLVAALDDDTLLVVMGDHGMDRKGDHGGEGDDEVQAALWMYARRPLFGRTGPEARLPPATAKERPVNQIDLVPTLALLLGLPIPYNNLGWPIEEAFVGPRGSDWANLASVAKVTAAAIHRYQTSYSAARAFSSPGNDVRTPTPPPLVGADPVEAFAALSAYQAETLRVSKALWTRFDVPAMALGLGIMASGVVALLLYVSRAGSGNDDDDGGIALLDDAELDRTELMLELQGELVNGSLRPGPGGSQDKEEDDLQALYQQHKALVVAGLLGGLPVLAGGAAWSAWVGGGVPWYATAGYAALASTLAVSARLLRGVGDGTQRRLWRLLPSSRWGWLAVVFTLAPSVGFASNSYTIWEDSILLFFLGTFGVVAAMESLRLRRPADRALGVYHAVVFVLLGRVASLSKLCREEQMPYCTSTYYASATTSTSAVWQLLVPFAVFLLLPTIVRSFYEPTRSYEGLAPVWVGYVLRGGLLLAAVHWVLDAADNGAWGVARGWWPKGAAKLGAVYVAQTVLGLALVAGTVAFVWASPCVAVSARAARGANRAQVAVLGYANAHGARYLLLPINLLIAGVLLSKPMGGGALALMLWQVLSLAELVDLLRSASDATDALDETDGKEKDDSDAGGAAAVDAEGDSSTAAAPAPAAVSSSSSASSVNVIGPIVLAMLANFHFFTTGHQATLSSIQWDSAFIPLRAVRYPWSPLVVAANTFPGHVLAAAAVPLLVLWKVGPRRRGGLLTPTSRALGVFAAYFAVEALATMLWAGHLRRHLMLYRVFSPRFMMAAAALLFVDVVALVVALPGLRANTLSVSEVFGWVEDY